MPWKSERNTNPPSTLRLTKAAQDVVLKYQEDHRTALGETLSIWDAINATILDVNVKPTPVLTRWDRLLKRFGLARIRTEGDHQ